MLLIYSTNTYHHLSLFYGKYKQNAVKIFTLTYILWSTTTRNLKNRVTFMKYTCLNSMKFQLGLDLHQFTIHPRYGTKQNMPYKGLEENDAFVVRVE